MTDKLELNKILQRLSEYTSCEEAKERVLNITPSTNVNEVEDLIQKTSDAYFLSSRYGTPPFFKMENPKENLRLAQVGGILNPKCIMNIASILRGTRAVKDWYGQCENVESSLSYLFQSLYPVKELEKRINQVFISEDEIADTASDQLYAIRKKIKSLGDKIKG
ncbi:MAG: endonuclease MutS2, partial [Oscillospiraceae bacterium]